MNGKYVFGAWIKGLFCRRLGRGDEQRDTDLNRRRVGFGRQRARSLWSSSFSSQSVSGEGGDY